MNFGRIIHLLSIVLCVLSAVLTVIWICVVFLLAFRPDPLDDFFRAFIFIWAAAALIFVALFGGIVPSAIAVLCHRGTDHARSLRLAIWAFLIPLAEAVVLYFCAPLSLA